MKNFIKVAALVAALSFAVACNSNKKCCQEVEETTVDTTIVETAPADTVVNE